MNRVGMYDTARVQQLSLQNCRARRDGAKHEIRTLGGYEVVSVRTSTTNSGGKRRHEFDLHAFDEFLEPAKFENVEPCSNDLIGIIDFDVDFCMAFNPSNRVYDNSSPQDYTPSCEIQRRSRNVGFCRNTGDAMAYA